MEFFSDIFAFWKDLILGMVGTKINQQQPSSQPATPFQVPNFLVPQPQPAPFTVVPPAPVVVPTATVVEKKPYSGSFNPNLIISDSEFLNCSSMSEAQIQDFIASKGSFLKDYKISDHLTSYWVYKHCNDLGLNPKVLLTHIQKEQGTITTKTFPKNKRRLDYFCGVGAYDPPRGDDPKWAGVDNQILGAVKVSVRRYQDALKLKFPYPYKTDTPECIKLEIQNAATRSIYFYTPFVGNGTIMIGKNKYEKPFANYLFWVIYSKWFGFEA